MAAGDDGAVPLSEADAAFYSFGCVMLALYIVPAVLVTLYRVLRAPKKLRTRGFALHLVVLAVALALFWRNLQALQSVDTSGVFDPYEILGVPDSASRRELQKAFRALGRKLHPDKNLHNPQAAAQFSRVRKAYEALTDPQAMENYRLYGHPDGRQSLLMDFAFLSAFTGSDSSSSNGSLFVLLYFALVFSGVAYLVYWLQKSAGRSDRSQVSRATRASFIEALREKMSVHDVVELLLSCDEMTGASGGITEEARMDALHRSKAHDKLVKKMEAAKALPSEALARIKKHPDPVARENMLALYQYLRRQKLRGVSRPAWVEPRFRKVLLELPFLVEIFASLAAEQCVKRAYPAIPLERALLLLASVAQGSLVPDDEALRDQRARLTAASDREIDALPQLQLTDTSLAVLDEPNVQPGDWLTLQTTLMRPHVAAGASAPLAATFYDAVDPASPFRKEFLWFLVVDKASGRLYAAWKCLDLSQQVTQKKGFLGPETPGKYELELRVVCPAYLGVQTKTTLSLLVENR